MNNLRFRYTDYQSLINFGVMILVAVIIFGLGQERISHTLKMNQSELQKCENVALNTEEIKVCRKYFK